jgi:hypothetical protein
MNRHQTAQALRIAADITDHAATNPRHHRAVGRILDAITTNNPTGLLHTATALIHDPAAGRHAIRWCQQLYTLSGHHEPTDAELAHLHAQADAITLRAAADHLEATTAAKGHQQ